MEKTVLTKDQAQALENALTCCDNKAAIVENHVNGLWSGRRKALNTLSLESLLVALYIGYEVERSREEKLLAYIQELNLAANRDPIGSSARLVGVFKTLEILGIELIEN